MTARLEQELLHHTQGPLSRQASAGKELGCLKEARGSTGWETPGVTPKHSVSGIGKGSQWRGGRVSQFA